MPPQATKPQEVTEDTPQDQGGMFIGDPPISRFADKTDFKAVSTALERVLGENAKSKLLECLNRLSPPSDNPRSQAQENFIKIGNLESRLTGSPIVDDLLTNLFIASQAIARYGQKLSEGVSPTSRPGIRSEQVKRLLQETWFFTAMGLQTVLELASALVKQAAHYPSSDDSSPQGAKDLISTLSGKG